MTNSTPARWQASTARAPSSETPPSPSCSSDPPRPSSVPSRSQYTQRMGGQSRLGEMPPALRVRGRAIPLGDRPALMGIVNASPESFSDGGRLGTPEDRLALADSLVVAGATFIDVGGESGVTGQPAIEPAEEIERVVPVIERVAAARPEVAVSVDTYKPAVAEAALEAGAALVNDVSGLRDPTLAEVCALFGA